MSRTSPETETLKPCPIGCTGISPQHMYREICRDMQSPNWNKPVSRIWCPCCGITMVKEGIEEVQAAWNIRKPGVAQCPGLLDEANILAGAQALADDVWHPPQPLRSLALYEQTKFKRQARIVLEATLAQGPDTDRASKP